VPDREVAYDCSSELKSWLDIRQKTLQIEAIKSKCQQDVRIQREEENKRRARLKKRSEKIRRLLKMARIMTSNPFAEDDTVMDLGDDKEYSKKKLKQEYAEIMRELTISRFEREDSCEYGILPFSINEGGFVVDTEMKAHYDQMKDTLQGIAQVRYNEIKKLGPCAELLRDYRWEVKGTIGTDGASLGGKVGND
jgi:hypothetical protein